MSDLFNAVIDSVNDFLNRINENSDNRIYDDNDSDWYLSEIVYDSNSDKLYFKCKEVKNGKITVEKEKAALQSDN